MKEVLINVEFRDVYTGEVYTPGKTYPMTEERVKEIKEVNPNFVTVVGTAKKGASRGNTSKKAEEKDAKAADAEATGDGTEGTDGEGGDGSTEGTDGE